MQNDFNEKDLGYLFFGFLVGVATGTAMGVLSAPRSGAKTRRMLRRRGEAFGDSLYHRGERVQDDLVRTGEDLIRQGREILDHSRRLVDEKVNEARHKVMG